MILWTSDFRNYLSVPSTMLPYADAGRQASARGLSGPVTIPFPA
jgi:hypothetical protein